MLIYRTSAKQRQPTTSLLFSVPLLIINLSLAASQGGDATPASVMVGGGRDRAENGTSTGATIRPESFDAGAIELLSSDEFVDPKGVPTILFDGLSNEEDIASANQTVELQTEPPLTRMSVGAATSEASQEPNSSTTTTPSPAEAAASRTITTTTTTSSPTIETNKSISATANETKHGSTIGGSSSKNKPVAGAEDEEEGEEEEPEEAGADEAGQPLDDTSGRPSRTHQRHTDHFEPPQNISEYMDYIEKLFHDLRHQITDLFEPHIPQLIRTSQMVELTSSCSYDMLRMALALRQFEPWALRMIDSSGKVPEGIFEGSFTALGSYDQCLSTVFQSPGSQLQQQLAAATSDGAQPSPPQPPPTQGKYCLVTLSPFMPPKPPADKVERMFQDEANRRNYTKEDQFSRLSPMFYYMKFRIGVCIPSTCQKEDMDSISSALSSSLRLNITIPDCRVKQAQVPLTRAQLVGGLVFGTVLLLVGGATLAHYFKSKWSKIKCQEARVRNQLAAGGVWRRQAATKTAQSQFNISMHERGGDLVSPATSSSRRRFEQQFGRHWSWMSFSLLANFRLNFQQRDAPLEEKRPEEALEKGSSEARGQTAASQQPLAQIACLNGIRVLSLCWVIVANSYLTLDPRATKRLSKTREAPRDFLFQLVVQASLAIETFFFLSGLLLSLSFAKRLAPPPSGERKARAGAKSALASWLHFYVHRYVRMTPPSMLVIAFSMYAYHFGDGPLWFEATQRVHESCSQNWWRHLLHVANFIDTRQMCFIHFWYIAADMQLFLAAPLVMLLLYKWRPLGYALIALAGALSIGRVFYTTYERNLPPTLLFYNTDPESRREFGNTIMTKPLTHALPYLVGMLLGWWLLNVPAAATDHRHEDKPQPMGSGGGGNGRGSLVGLAGLVVAGIALAELFLPYQWNNSHLPSRTLASAYAALFRLGWSLVLVYIVLACRHRRSHKCRRTPGARADGLQAENCFCPSGGNLINRLLGLGVFAQLSKLSFVAYLIHLPLMSVFIGQTRGLFAFSHSLVIHFAISYLVMTFTLAFILVHIIEFPFLTFERHLLDRLLNGQQVASTTGASGQQLHSSTKTNHLAHGGGGAANGPTKRRPLSSPADGVFVVTSGQQQMSVCERL